MTTTDSEPVRQEISWEPPGPGTWEFDAAHQQRPYPVSMFDWAQDAIEDGFRAGFELVGIPLDTMAVRSVHGWAYMHPVPLGGKDDGGGMPPRFVLSLVFALVPAMRRRHSTAKSVFSDRPWNDLVTAWQTTGRPRALDRHAALAATDLQACDDAALAAHVVAVHAAAADAFRTHFTHAVPAASVTGRFALRTSELTGQSVDAAFEMLSGYSTATTEPFDLLDAVVAELPATLDLSDEPEAVLAAIEGHCGPARSALAAYLDRYGDTIVADESPLNPTLRELPNVIVASLRARQAGTNAQPRDRADRLAREARALVPASDRPEWDQLLADARRVTALRDDDVGVALRLVGLSRLAILEVGRRLHARGTIREAESAFDVTTTEIVALLDGRSITTDPDEQRRARLLAAAETPPPILGPPEDPPDFSPFPTAIRHVTEAAFAFINRLDGPGDADDLAGVGIGTGSVEGTARIVNDITDLGKVRPGDILVTPMTTPAYNATIASSAALVCDHGGTASHAAIMAREFGIPAVVGTHAATTSLIDGETVIVDPRAGLVTPKR